VVSAAIRFRVRPVYRGSDLLVEVLDDHRAAGFPDVASLLREALHAVQMPHPEGLDDARIAMSQDRYFSFWVYPGGSYEIDDDIWGLFVWGWGNNHEVTADVERAFVATGQFVKEFVVFAQFR
jgi:hypothetical protein